jgi:hypothetical protein
MDREARVTWVENNEDHTKLFGTHYEAKMFVESLRSKGVKGAKIEKGTMHNIGKHWYFR